jgi:acetoin utilization deacetylase AcuC-like enzyme
MTLLLRSFEFLKHKTGKHPERPERLTAIENLLEKSGLASKCQSVSWEPLAEKELMQLHAPKQVEQIRQIAAHGGGRADPDTVICPDSFKVSLYAAGACVKAVDEVVSGKHQNALSLVRPPGHHANAVKSMGFCLFNNVALAAKRALSHHKINRVLIVDWDVHHGNGTQDIFYEDPQVFFFSIHRFGNGFYPGTGAANETGTLKGLGTTLNVPLPYGVARKDYLAAWEKNLQKAFEFKPELVIVSAGFDADHRDPVGDLGLEPEDFGNLTKSIQSLANSSCKGRLVSCLEGGYSLEGLSEGVKEHLSVLLAKN